MPRDKRAGFRLDLGPELEAKLADFCTAFYKASKTEIIRQALEEHIDSVLASEPERKRRYDDVRRDRLGLSKRVVTLIKSDES